MDRFRATERTCVGVLTPQGRGAVSVLRVWGPNALEMADAAFRPAQGGSLAGSRVGRLRLGRVGTGLGDEVVAVIVSAAPPVVEIHSHGGPAAVSLVVESLAALGAAVESPARWMEANAVSALSAQAEVDLAAAVALRPAEILLDQYHGAFERELTAARNLIAPAPERARDLLNVLLERAALGCRLLGGWRVALAGRPNVGKSRLLNALAGYERAIVDPAPGTTRDMITVRTALGGWPVELWDTAGLRAAGEGVEAAGVALARRLHAEADLVVVVLDRSEPRTEVDDALIRSHAAALRVANKADLPASWPSPEADFAVVSALEGLGIDGLIAAIADRLVPVPPPAGAGVPFRGEHVRFLTEARDALGAGKPERARDRIDVLVRNGSRD